MADTAPEREPRCLTHRQPVSVCNRTSAPGRCSVTAEDYALMEAAHIRFHDLMRTPECDVCGRCVHPHRECRCYWPERVDDAPVVTTSRADRQPPASSSVTKGGQGPGNPDA